MLIKLISKIIKFELTLTFMGFIGLVGLNKVYKYGEYLLLTIKNIKMKGGENMRRLNKKGAEMTIGTLVVIVLAIIVLVVIALGFGTGWSNLWSKITGYFGGGSNVDSIKQACSYACTTQATYDYCSLSRDVTYVDTKGDKQTAKGENCASLAKGYSSWGFTACPGITCAGELKCQGNAKTCAQLDLGTVEADKKTKCEDKQQMLKSDGTTLSKCKFTAAVAAAGTTAAVVAKCELATAGDVAIACNKITGADETEKQTNCAAQQGCTWS